MPAPSSAPAAIFFGCRRMKLLRVDAAAAAGVPADAAAEAAEELFGRVLKVRTAPLVREAERTTLLAVRAAAMAERCMEGEGEGEGGSRKEEARADV